MRLYGVSFLLAGVIMLIITLVKWLKNLSFKNSELTTATVKELKTGSVHMNGRRVTTYGLQVAYTVDGKDYSRELPCNKAEYDRGTGRQVEIRYKKEKPEKIAPGDTAVQTRNQRVLWIITLALLAVGAALLFI